MKKIFFALLASAMLIQTAQAQLSNLDVAGGLKEALNKGVEQGVKKLSVTDGFFKNLAVKILIPPDAQKIEKTLRNMGFGEDVDKAILSMNRAAEDASKSAAPIFLNAIKSMSISDAMGILKGGDSSATIYLRTKTTPELTTAFTPVIKASLDKVDATKYWNAIVTKYNMVPFVKKINPDLTAYVTQKALSGLFYEIAQEEVSIRKNPVARTTDILKKVFGGL